MNKKHGRNQKKINSQVNLMENNLHHSEHRCFIHLDLQMGYCRCNRKRLQHNNYDSVLFPWKDVEQHQVGKIQQRFWAILREALQFHFSAYLLLANRDLGKTHGSKTFFSLEEAARFELTVGHQIGVRCFRWKEGKYDAWVRWSGAIFNTTLSLRATDSR